MIEISSPHTARSCVSTRLLPPLSHVCLVNDEDEEEGRKKGTGRQTHAVFPPSEYETREQKARASAWIEGRLREQILNTRIRALDWKRGRVAVDC